MKSRISFSIAAFCLLSPCVLAGGLRLQWNEGLQWDGEIQDVMNSPGRLLGERDGFRMYSVPSALRVTRDSFRAGQGRGGDVAGLSTTQVAYSDPINANVVLLAWDETTSNASGVNVFVDDGLITAVPGLPGPGTRTVCLGGFSDGLFTIKVESIDDGTTSEATQLFVGEQPFSDATNFNCRPGNVGSPDACDLHVAWENPGPAPEVYVVLLNGVPVATIPGDALELTVENARPGPYTVSLVGFSTAEDENGEYRGGFPETTCNLVCEVAVPVETPTLHELGLLGLVSILLGIGCWLLRRAPAATRRA